MLRVICASDVLGVLPIFNVEYTRRKIATFQEKILLATKLLPYQIISFCGYAISLIVMINFFEIPMRGSWIEALILGLGFIFFVSNVLLIFAAVAPNEVLALQAPMIYIMPGLLYSGLSFPIFDMSENAEFVARLMPITYAGDNLRDILLSGYAPNFWSDFSEMIFCGLISLTVATAFFLLKGRLKNDSVANNEA